MTTQEGLPALATDAELVELRRIIADCAAALGNGTYISPEASAEFMALLPAEIRALLDRLEAAERQVKELREANRKLHRRAQIAEAFMRSAEDIPNGWLNVLKNQVSRQDIVQRTIVDEIVKAKERARATLEAQSHDD